MKVISLCQDDYANFMYCQHLAMLSVGIQSECYKTQPHVYKYPEQATVIKTRRIETMKADVYLIFHTNTTLVQYINTQNNPTIIYVHTGTRFRQAPRRYTDETKANGNIICLPEFKFHLPNADYIVGTIDTRIIQIRPAITNRFAHYPSNAEVKGSVVIEKVCRNLGVNLLTGPNTNYQAHLTRLKHCDIYIEMFKTEQNGKNYGSFGMTALEAASMGKVVITNNTTGQQLYEQTYGNCELVICNTEQELSDTIKYYKDAPTTIKGRSTLEWFKQNHSFEATGTRFKNAILRHAR